MPLLLSFPVFANWTGDTKADTKTVTGSGSVSSENNKSDTLPEGVTQNWLNSLTDEKGNKIAPEEDPEGDSFQRKTFNGLSASSRFGFAVNTAGDVNGDGFDDVIIGSYLYSSGIGRAYIYYGGLIMNTVADIIITGLGSGYNFGYSVSTAGDVNGDGYSDVIIGAPGYSTNTGRAYIYFGGLNMNTGTFLTLSGEAAGNFFGGSVSSAGDVNGDGYSDVIAGAYGYSSNTGRAYVYYGGASMNNVVDVTITGAAINYNLGFSVSNAGDFNGDGYSDVIA
ncbi:MAG: integrin alpha, partial [Ignavibacteria bacterium]